MTLQLLSFNDFHGHLAPPTGSDAALPGATGSYGGSAYLASALEQLRPELRRRLHVAFVGAVRPDDVLVRRSGWAYHDGPDPARREQVTRWMTEAGS